MNRDMIGYSVEKFSSPILPDETEAYAKAIGHKVWLNSDRTHIPPFFLAKLIFPTIKEILFHKNLDANILRLVHANQEAHYYRLIKVGENLRFTVTIKDIIDKSAGEILQVVGKIYSDKELVVEMTSGFIVRSKSKNKKKKSDEPKEKLKELFNMDIQTWKGQQYEYTDASDDNSFIHTSNILAKLAGFPGTILQGLCVAGMASTHFIEHEVENEYWDIAGFYVKFSAITIPGDKLKLICYESKDKNEIPFEVLSPSGKPVLSNGIFYKR